MKAWLLVVSVALSLGLVWACSSDESSSTTTTSSTGTGGGSTSTSSGGGQGGSGATGGSSASGTGGSSGAGGSATGGGGQGGSGGAGGSLPDWAQACATAPHPVEVVGGGTYNTVGAAVFAAPAGATVRICPGTYVESGILIERDLTLVGAGQTQTIIQGTGGQAFVFEGSNADITFEDLTVEQGAIGFYYHATDPQTVVMRRATFTQNSDGGLAIYGPNNNGEWVTVTLEQVTLSHNQAAEGAGLYIDTRVTATLTGCTVENNTATSDGGGMYLDSGSEATVVNSTVRMNTAAMGGGAYLRRDSYNGLSTLDITTSDWGAGQSVENSPDDVLCGALYQITNDVSVGWLGTNVTVQCVGTIQACCQ
ncbi:MAG: right-handed parallel beta-helix repeat-containing protein [Deltaproteobacteria bacterium]|nr:right-handed parallel beta-helix repeat-containing protein [Deltaproteobacteria bacterium]